MPSSSLEHVMVRSVTPLARPWAGEGPGVRVGVARAQAVSKKMTHTKIQRYKNLNIADARRSAVREARQRRAFCIFVSLCESSSWFLDAPCAERPPSPPAPLPPGGGRGVRV